MELIKLDAKTEAEIVEVDFDGWNMKEQQAIAGGHIWQAVGWYDENGDEIACFDFNTWHLVKWVVVASAKPGWGCQFAIVYPEDYDEPKGEN